MKLAQKVPELGWHRQSDERGLGGRLKQYHKQHSKGGPEQSEASHPGEREPADITSESTNYPQIAVQARQQSRQRYG